MTFSKERARRGEPLSYVPWRSVRRGSDNARSILTEDRIPEIFEAVASMKPMSQVAGEFGVHRHTIENVIGRTRWGHVHVPRGLVVEARRACEYWIAQPVPNVVKVHRELGTFPPRGMSGFAPPEWHRQMRVDSFPG